MALNMFQDSLLVQNIITTSQLSFILYYYIILIRNMFRRRTKSHHHAKWDYQSYVITSIILTLRLLSHTNKCTNYIIYYSKSVLIIDIKTLPYFHNSYMFRHITFHPQGALMFLAKITGKTICKTWTYIVWRVWQHICKKLFLCKH
jgi:hypothetical protein